MKTRKKLNLNKETIVALNDILGGRPPVKPLSWNPKKCETMLQICQQPSRDYACLSQDAECI